MDVYVENRVIWPQAYVLTSQNKQRVTYNQLTSIQWMAGFCWIMREDPVSENRDSMLDYVINLLEDAMDFSWSSAKASYADLLCLMEQGEIGDWPEVEKTPDRVRHVHALRHTSHQKLQC